VHNLNDLKKKEVVMSYRTKKCPGCGKSIPSYSSECYTCGYKFRSSYNSTYHKNNSSKGDYDLGYTVSDYIEDMGSSAGYYPADFNK
jgi:tRNA(Ile2) C34 agmatinyltransferase TiaS